MAAGRRNERTIMRCLTIGRPVKSQFYDDCVCTRALVRFPRINVGHVSIPYYAYNVGIFIYRSKRKQTFLVFLRSIFFLLLSLSPFSLCNVKSSPTPGTRWETSRHVFLYTMLLFRPSVICYQSSLFLDVMESSFPFLSVLHFRCGVR